MTGLTVLAIHHHRHHGDASALLGIALVLLLIAAVGRG